MLMNQYQTELADNLSVLLADDEALREELIREKDVSITHATDPFRRKNIKPPAKKGGVPKIYERNNKKWKWN